MITAQVVEMSVTINNNSPFQDYVHPDDHIQPTFVWNDFWIQTFHRSKTLAYIIKNEAFFSIKKDLCILADKRAVIFFLCQTRVKELANLRKPQKISR